MSLFHLSGILISREKHITATLQDFATHYRDIFFPLFRSTLPRHFFLLKYGFLELITATFINCLQDIYMYNEYMFND